MLLPPKPSAATRRCLCVRKPLSETLLAAIAAEFNYRDGIFNSAGENSWDLRWFTPTTEVNLCGHATLAAAWVLWQEHKIQADLYVLIRAAVSL